MVSMEMNQKLELISSKFKDAYAIVKLVGKELKEKNEIIIEMKNNDISDLVTNCDVEVQNKIMNSLKEKYVEDSWLCEENVNEILNSNLWILDPIDGTTNFISQRCNYAVSLAYYHQGKPTFGIVYDVVNDEVFHCITDQGAFVNQTRLMKLPISEMKESILNGSIKSLLGFNKQHGLNLEEISKKIRAHRSLGCSSLAICHLAQNKEQLFISNHIKIWDYAAARIILEEVGGNMDVYYTLNTLECNQTCIAATSKELLQQFISECNEWN